MRRKPDFSGYATKNDIKCSDGRVIRKDAFKHNDGQTVPLVWMHQRKNPENVLGHAILENREDGVFAYGYFNDTQYGRDAKELVQHGDITKLSIYANQLQQRGDDVIHGSICEVSLVLAGANPGASIQNVVLAHSDEPIDDEAVIYPDDSQLSMAHADENPEDQKGDGDSEDGDGETVNDVFNSLTEKQKNVVYYMIGQALENAGVKSGDDEATTVEVTFLRQRDQLLKTTANFLRTGKSRRDRLVSNQRAHQPTGERQPLIGFAAEFAAFVSVTMHIKYLTPLTFL